MSWWHDAYLKRMEENGTPIDPNTGPKEPYVSKRVETSELIDYASRLPIEEMLDFCNQYNLPIPKIGE